MPLVAQPWSQFIEVETGIYKIAGGVQSYISQESNPMSLLANSTTRLIKSQPLPFQRSYQLEQIYFKGIFDIEKLINFLEREGRLRKTIIQKIIKQGENLFKMESNLIKLQNPLTIVGDIHGQFYDLVGILDRLHLGKEKILFLGDYVDRGCFSIEVLAILLCMKINWPTRVFLLRGNHECEQMTNHFNFRQQCLHKYDQEIYACFLDLFNSMPLAATIDQTFLCLHGGIASSLSSLEKIGQIYRFQQIPSQGLFCDMLWADPTLQSSGIMGPTQQIINSQRGCSYIFGLQIAQTVLQHAKVKCLIRGHQAEEEGFRLFHWLSKKDFPQVITIFSAPNYCDFYGNKASIMKIQNNNIEIKQFGPKEHPFLLPDFMDVFEWSIPFVTEKVTEMMINLLQPTQGMQFDERNDISLIVKSQIMRKFLQESKKITKENIGWANIGYTLDNLLAHDEEAQQFLLRRQESSGTAFDKKREIDLKNQKRPLFESIQL